jgi:hypothetical protein
MEKHVYLDRGLRGWIVNTSRAQHWRVSSWYSLEDLEQDGYLCYAKCWHHYRTLFDVPEPTPDQRRHFMALVKTAYVNHIATLSTKFPVRCGEIAVSQLDLPLDEKLLPREASEDLLDRLLPPEAEQASVLCALAKLPVELADVVERLLQDGFDGGKYLRRKINNGTGRTKHKVRETTAEYWERVLGQPNVPEKLAAYLMG